MCALIAVGAVAQKKPNINKAKTLLMQGKLDEAKSIIDEAIVFEKIKDDGKTWYYRALIYTAIDTTSNPQYSGLANNAMEIALEAYDKAEKLGDPNKDYFISEAPTFIPETRQMQISSYYEFYFNKAISFYQNDDYDNASLYFERASLIVPSDSSALTNSALAAHAGEDMDRALKLYERAIEKGIKSKNVIFSAVNICMTQKNLQKALDLIQIAKESFPNDQVVLRTEINILISMGKSEEARDKIISSIQNSPDDPLMYFVLGILYEELKDPGKAKEAYKKGLEINPDYYECWYNLGVIMFNELNVTYKEFTSLGVSPKDMKRAKELEPVIEKKMLETIPIWEKAYAIKPKDSATLSTLMLMYNFMDMQDKVKKMSKELDALGPMEDDN
jgi:tetratricopeptide (TPR) repeat protein